MIAIPTPPSAHKVGLNKSQNHVLIGDCGVRLVLNAQNRGDKHMIRSQKKILVAAAVAGLVGGVMAEAKLANGSHAQTIAGRHVSSNTTTNNSCGGKDGCGGKGGCSSKTNSLAN